jgi:hypothetical protein
LAIRSKYPLRNEAASMADLLNYTQQLYSYDAGSGADIKLYASTDKNIIVSDILRRNISAGLVLSCLKPRSLIAMNISESIGEAVEVC